MRIVFFALIFFIYSSGLTLAANCDKEQVCAMVKKMSPFTILDKCPGAGPLIVECKKAGNNTTEDLPESKFVDNGDGTITDTVNRLLWSKSGVKDKRVNFKDAQRYAASATVGDISGWRLPTLTEMKTLLNNERTKNASGEKAWIKPEFNDGRGVHYWTTTSCTEVNYIVDRYQKKICQEGESAVWLIHFNVGAIFWQFLNKPIYHIWLVKSL
tara:strand:+ start:642 stop:1280 length:639 start_codon:yes stop_codon:yes gene_type:complete